MHPTPAALIALATLAAPATAQTTRYWVGPTTGNWDDPANWSTFPGSTPAGGLPQTGDTINLIGPSRVTYTTASIPSPTFATLLLTGTTTNPLTLAHDADTLILDPLNPDALLQLNNAAYTNTGGNLYTPLLQTRNTATILLTSHAGTFAATTLLAPAPDGPAHTATIAVSGGQFTANTLTLGKAAGATYRQTGGAATFETFTLGAHDPTTENHQPATARLSDGTTRVTDTLTIGADANGQGQLTIDGGHLTVTQLRTLEGRRAAATITLTDGTLDTTTTYLNTNGANPDYHATFTQTGGTFTADRFYVGYNENRSPATYHLTGGTADIRFLTYVASTPHSNATLHIDNARFSTGQLHLASGDDAAAVCTLTNGATLNTDYVYIASGERAEAYLAITDATLNARRINIYDDGNAELHLNHNATVNATELNLDGTLYLDGGTINTTELNLTDRAWLFDGTINAQTLTITPNARVAAYLLATTRADTLVNQGLLELRTIDTTPRLTGTMTDAPNPVPTTGTLVNAGSLTITTVTDQPATIDMSLDNLDTLTLADGAELLLLGSYHAHADSTINTHLTPDTLVPLTISANNAHLEGTLNITTDPKAPTPPLGTQLDIIRCFAGTITGSFHTVTLNGAPVELTYTPTRAYLLFTRCSPADINADATLNNADINAFVNAFIRNNPAADLNNDGFINATDYNRFINAFLAGCP